MAEEEKDEQNETSGQDAPESEAAASDADTPGDPEPDAAESDAGAEAQEPEESESSDDPPEQEPEPVAEAEEDAPPAAAEEPADATADGDESADSDAIEASTPEAAALRREKKPRKTREEKAKRRDSKKRTRAKSKSDKRKPIVRLPKPEQARGARKERRGVVVSSKMDKTIVVRVESARPHPLYKKIVRRSVKFYAHDEDNVAKQGDIVRIIETRPLSKTKRWRLAEVVEKAT